MKVVTPLFLLIAVMAAILNARQITGYARYQYGDSESSLEAKDKCKVLAMRNALESFAIYIESMTDIQNFKLTKDQIRTATKAVLTDLSFEQEELPNRIIVTKVYAQVDEEKVLKSLQKYAQSSSTKSNADLLSVKDFVPLFSNSYLQIIDVIKDEQTQQNAYTNMKCFKYVIKIKYKKSLPPTEPIENGFIGIGKSIRLYFDLSNEDGSIIGSKSIQLYVKDSCPGNYLSYTYEYQTSKDATYQPDLRNYRVVFVDIQGGNKVLD